MSCEKCTTTPIFPYGKHIVYINAGHDYVLDKVNVLLAEKGWSPTFNQTYTIVNTDCFSKLIKEIASYSHLTSLEKKNINLLPLKSDETLNFGIFAKTRTLENWFILLNSEDLIWILKNNSICIHFQPIVDVKEMRIYAYECLARGMLQNNNLMNPGTMFETARKTGMLFNLDRQCRETAIKTASVKRIEKNIFINFSPSAIYNPESCLQDTVKWARELEFDPLTIVFEVVETEKVDDTDHLLNILNFYKKKGFRTALDDVGSGYSSLNLFASIQPDLIKIDINLIRDIHFTEVKQAVVKTLIKMAKESNCKVLAEGIEYASEFEWLKNQGVDYVQGYYFARPSSDPILQI